MTTTVLLLCILFLFHPTSVTPAANKNRTLAQLANSPFEIHDWSVVGRTKLNRKLILNDTQKICCTTNYSVVWDTDDELIVFAADNFFCPSTVETLKLDALGPDRLWETFTQALNRVHKHGAKLGKKYYSGNYPGVTTYPVHYDIVMAMRRCIGPFAHVLLDAEQYSLRRLLLNRKLSSTTPHVDDANDLKEMSWQHTGTGDNNEDEEEDDDDDDDNDDEQQNIAGNPILPFFSKLFYASAAFPASNLTAAHSAPHVDGEEAGLASVFTLTSDSKYEASGTTFNKVAGNISIVHNGEVSQSVGVTRTLKQADAVENDESAEEGWMNTTRNRFSEIIVLAYNKYNRMIMYPSNRYHTAFIPNPTLLSANPRKGRLTMNTFWDTFSFNNEGNCNSILWSHMISKRTQEGFGLLNESRSMIPRTSQEVLSACNACKSWQSTCSWCPYSATCVGIGDFTEKCPTPTVAGLEFNPLNRDTTCENAALLVGSCLEHGSCSACNEAGCAWCASKGRCLRNIEKACNSQYEHVVKNGDQTCQPEFNHHDCTQHTVCHACTKQGCTWCEGAPPGRSCLATVDTVCGKDVQKDQIVGKFGEGTCAKEVQSERATKKIETIPISFVEEIVDDSSTPSEVFEFESEL